MEAGRERQQCEERGRKDTESTWQREERLKGRGIGRRGGEGSGRDDRDRDNKWGVYTVKRSSPGG